VLSAVTYRLDLPPTWRIHNAFHAAVLHPYKETELHGPNFMETSPDLVEGHEEWEVNSVLVTAAYATITDRLGVVMTRLLAAAFWLGVGRIADIAVVRRTGDST
jgi:hypothetical protein